MDELSPRQITIHDGFWSPRLEINATHAIFHQWQMLEASGCIDNFRIAAGEKEGFREGWFFADSDATKWLDAASRIERNQHDEKLSAIIVEFILLLGRVQSPDGYLFTYNQIHFPGQRWVNLQIEHELYCHGHLIEAGVSHFQATGRTELLTIARKAADLLVRDSLQAGPAFTPGHEEVEIALLRLWQVTGYEPYRELAIHFLEMRGRTRFFGASLLRQFISNSKREKFIASQRQIYQMAHPEHLAFQLPEKNKSKRPPFSELRFSISGLNGKYFQQHRPIRKQTVPVGHSVRLGYLATAEAMLLNSRPEDELLSTLKMNWEHMVTRRMDVSGGLGALPDSEGFGNDYELNPETAYNETCAALSSLFWNWQMTLLTQEARYSDLFEWQLYNAASVGMGLNGESYFYNNPTLCRGGITRQVWYSIPCCPSNLSRTYADLGNYVITKESAALWVHQYIGCQTDLILNETISLDIQSGIPWSGEASIKIHTEQPQEFKLHLRIPSWVDKYTVMVNGVNQELPMRRKIVLEPSAVGYDPRLAFYLPINRIWSEGDEIKLHFEIPIRILHPHPKVKELKDQVAFARGPLLYCLESIDQPERDIFTETVDLTSLKVETAPDLLGGIQILKGRTVKGRPLVFIPYSMWGNRGESKMTVWVKVK